MPTMSVGGMPTKLSRGGEWVTSDGSVRDARWERMGHEKDGEWHWRHNPFSKTRAHHAASPVTQSYPRFSSSRSTFSTSAIRSSKSRSISRW